MELRCQKKFHLLGLSRHKFVKKIIHQSNLSRSPNTLKKCRIILHSTQSQCVNENFLYYFFRSFHSLKVLHLNEHACCQKLEKKVFIKCLRQSPLATLAIGIHRHFVATPSFPAQVWTYKNFLYIFFFLEI